MAPTTTKDNKALNIIAEAADKAASKIDIATEKAATVLASAADKATTAIASAAKDASVLLASNASDAIKVSSAKNESDHDLLIELKTEMRGMRADIKTLNDGISIKIQDHEARIFALENSRTKQTVLVSIGIGLLTFLAGLLSSHMIFGVGK